MLVQVLRGPTPNKGARLTTHISLAGHYLVYMPTLTQLGVSRRINDEPERQRIKGLLEEAWPAAGGLIARTASQAQGLQATRERDLLMVIWQRLRRKKGAPPARASCTRNWKPPGGWCGSSSPRSGPGPGG